MSEWTTEHVERQRRLWDTLSSEEAETYLQRALDGRAAQDMERVDRARGGMEAWLGSGTPQEAPESPQEPSGEEEPKEDTPEPPKTLSEAMGAVLRGQRLAAAGEGLAETPKAMAFGTLEAVEELGRFVQDAGELAGRLVPEEIEQVWEKGKRILTRDGMNPFGLMGEALEAIPDDRGVPDLTGMLLQGYEPEGLLSLVAGAAQFGVGIGLTAPVGGPAAGAVAKGVQALPGAAATAAKAAAAGSPTMATRAAMADFATFDPEEGALPALAELFPELNGWIPDFMRTREPDAEMLNRLKNMVEGAFIGAALESTWRGVRKVVPGERRALQAEEPKTEAESPGTPPPEFKPEPGLGADPELGEDQGAAGVGTAEDIMAIYQGKKPDKAKAPKEVTEDPADQVLAEFPRTYDTDSIREAAQLAATDLFTAMRGIREAWRSGRPQHGLEGSEKQAAFRVVADETAVGEEAFKRRAWLEDTLRRPTRTAILDTEADEAVQDGDNLQLVLSRLTQHEQKPFKVGDLPASSRVRVHVDQRNFVAVQRGAAQRAVEVGEEWNRRQLAALAPGQSRKDADLVSLAGVKKALRTGKVKGSPKLREELLELAKTAPTGFHKMLREVPIGKGDEMAWRRTHGDPQKPDQPVVGDRVFRPGAVSRAEEGHVDRSPIFWSNLRSTDDFMELSQGSVFIARARVNQSREQLNQTQIRRDELIRDRDEAHEELVKVLGPKTPAGDYERIALLEREITQASARRTEMWKAGQVRDPEYDQLRERIVTLKREASTWKEQVAGKSIGTAPGPEGKRVFELGKRIVDADQELTELRQNERALYDDAHHSLTGQWSEKQAGRVVDDFTLEVLGIRGARPTSSWAFRNAVRPDLKYTQMLSTLDVLGEGLRELGARAARDGALPEDRAAFMRAMHKTHAYIRWSMGHDADAKSIMDRAQLEMDDWVSKPGAPDPDRVISRARKVRELTRQSGGSQRVQAMAAVMAQATDARGALGIFSTWRDQAEYAWSLPAAAGVKAMPKVLTEVRLNNMLSGVSTQAKNVLGTAMFYPVRMAEQYLADTMADRPGTPGAGQRLVEEAESLWQGVGDGLYWFRKDLAGEWDWGGKAKDERAKALMEGHRDVTRKMFEEFIATDKHDINLRVTSVGLPEAMKDRLETGPLEAAGHMIDRGMVRLLTAPTKVLQATDLGFKVMGYRAAIRREAMLEADAAGLTDKAWRDRVEALVSRPSPQMNRKAHETARRLTFTSEPREGWMAAMMEARQRFPASTAVAVPFMRVLVNLTHEGVLRTPVVRRWASPEARRILREGTDEERRLLKAQGIMGSTALFGAAALALNGTITGGLLAGGAEAELAERRGGRKAHSVRIPGTDTTLSYREVPAVKSMLSLGADLGTLLMTAWDEREYRQAVEFGHVASSVLAGYMDEHFGPQLLEMISDFGSGDERAIGRYLRRTAVAQVPPLTAQRVKLVRGFHYHGELRSHEARGGMGKPDEGQFEKAMEWLETTKNEIWASFRLGGQGHKLWNPMTGEPVNLAHEPDAGMLERGIGKMSVAFSPLVLGKRKDNPLSVAMYDLAFNTGWAPDFLFPPGLGSDGYRESVELTPDEYETYSRDVAKEFFRHGTAMVKSEDFQRSPENVQRDRLAVLWGAAKARGREMLLRNPTHGRALRTRLNEAFERSAEERERMLDMTRERLLRERTG